MDMEITVSGWVFLNKSLLKLTEEHERLATELLSASVRNLCSKTDGKVFYPHTLPGARAVKVGMESQQG